MQIKKDAENVPLTKQGQEYALQLEQNVHQLESGIPLIAVCDAIMKRIRIIVNSLSKGDRMLDWDAAEMARRVVEIEFIVKDAVEQGHLPEQDGKEFLESTGKLQQVAETLLWAKKTEWRLRREQPVQRSGGDN